VSRLTGGGLRRVSVRVALGATAVVAVIFAIACAVIDTVVERSLVSDIDARLSRVASRFGEAGPLPPTFQRPLVDPEARPFGAPLLIWFVRSDGSVVSSDATAELPGGDRQLGEPATVSIGGSDVRLVPRQLSSGDRVVVGQTTAAVNQSMTTLYVGEGLVAPLLLLGVFGGALTVGRRVAAPIERARRRQLEFTADASHELRTPLAVIEAETSLALSQARESGADQAALERIEAEGRHLRRLVDDLLWLARFDAAPAPPDAEPVNVATVAQLGVERFRPLAERSGLRLQAIAEESSPAVIVAPPEWLSRLVGVLLDNACRYTPGGGAVTAMVQTDASTVRLDIIDTGPGVPAAERDRIFDRFHRAAPTSGGAGLGLAIGDAVVRATGGRWEVGEAPGGGASFAVRWPRAPGAEMYGEVVSAPLG